MNHAEAQALEAQLSDEPPTRQVGTVHTTDADNNKTTSEAFFSAEDIVPLLDRGMDIREAIASLGGVTVHG